MSATRAAASVPPDEESYVLRRVWLTKDDEEGYYYGFEQHARPLCHQVFCRPTFDPAHWAVYRKVNEQLCGSSDEAGDEPARVRAGLHFALLPGLLKAARPDLVVAQFWHIPWPNSEKLLLCPWAEEILDGMLGNDLLGFQTQQHCNNFLETVDRALECRIDREKFAVTRGGRETSVRPFPISVDPDLAKRYLGNHWETRATGLRKKYRLANRPLLIGVDRVDYKGHS